MGSDRKDKEGAERDKRKAKKFQKSDKIFIQYVNIFSSVLKKTVRGKWSSFQTTLEKCVSYKMLNPMTLAFLTPGKNTYIVC